MGPKKFGPEIKCGSEKNLGLKKNWVKKKIWGQKKFGSEKILGPQIFVVVLALLVTWILNKIELEFELSLANFFSVKNGILLL